MYNKFNEIPGPLTNNGNNLEDIAKANGLHHFQLHLHNQYGNIAKFYLSNDTPVVSINDHILIEITKNILHAPKRLYAFLEPLIDEEGVLPPEEAVKRRKVFTEALGKASIFEENYPNILKYTEIL